MKLNTNIASFSNQLAFKSTQRGPFLFITYITSTKLQIYSGLNKKMFVSCHPTVPTNGLDPSKSFFYFTKITRKTLFSQFLTFFFCKLDFPSIFPTKSLLATTKIPKKSDLPTLTFLGMRQETNFFLGLIKICGDDTNAYSQIRNEEEQTHLKYNFNKHENGCSRIRVRICKRPE